MHSVTIFLLGANRIDLQFKTAEAAAKVEEAFDKAVADGEPEFITLTDHYSRRVRIRLDEIAALHVGDLKQALEGASDAGILQLHAQIAAQQKAQSDPKIKFAAAMMPGLVKPS